ncbi:MULTISPECIES: hypothetical protein [Spirulina sp. CCY15215]|uniref:ArnT family glycosyltransferase n=1 Tax=Spirulina sp. CCY15215 TaxID=2767591 RepID=UPI00195119AB|nr:hypothetical protein [Spirulina major]
MEYRSLVGIRSRDQFSRQNDWPEWLWGLGLLLAALLVFGVNLSVPLLQDGSEVALALQGRAIAASPHFPQDWLLISPDQPLAGHEFSLLSVLIAFAYRWGGIDEGMTRWPIVGLATLSVFFLYRTGREVFARRSTAIISAWIYLVLSPLVPLGRFALPTVASSCFVLMTIWLTLRSRRDFRWTMGIGLGLSLLGLTQGGLAIILGGVVLSFLAWDTPRLLRSLYLWAGLLLGSFPFIGYILLHSFSLTAFFALFSHPSILLSQSYGLKTLCFALPGFLLGLSGLSVAITNWNWGWAKLTLTWFSGAFIAIPLFSFSLESSLLLFPPLALAGGAKLRDLFNSPSDREYSSWSFLAIALAFVATISSLGFASLFPLDRASALVCAAVALCLAMVALTIAQQDRQVLILLFWGMYIALFLFGSTIPTQEFDSASSLDSLLQSLRETPQNQVIYTSLKNQYAAFAFYSDRPIATKTDLQLEQLWYEKKHPYVLLHRDRDRRIIPNLNNAEILGTTSSENWLLQRKRSP